MLGDGGPKKTIKFKLPSLGITETQFAAMPFGRQIEPRRAILAWKATAKSVHLSQKRQSYTKAIRDFVRLYRPTEYYTEFWATRDYYDDSFEIFFKTAGESV